MKKFLVLFLPLLIAVIIFIIVAILLNTNKNKGALQVTSTPNSKVYLNNKYIGNTPLCKCELKQMFTPGDYVLKLVPESGNLDPFEENITINPKVLTVLDREFNTPSQGETSIISLSALQGSKESQLSAISIPDNAQIFLDSNLVGKSPLLLKNISASDHEIKIIKDGFKDKLLRVRAVLGYKLDILVYLGANPQIASSSAMIVATTSATLSISKVLILNTPTGFLRVRNEASLTGKEVAQVKPGKTYPLVQEQDSWLKIKVDDNIEGWISSDYAQKQ
jgi:hypothetical protein